MAAIERKPGLRRMVEMLEVDPSEVHRRSAMFGVAPFAFPGDIAVNAFSPRHPLGDGLVATQAFRRGERAARFMALLAVGEPFKLRVGL